MPYKPRVIETGYLLLTLGIHLQTSLESVNQAGEKKHMNFCASKINSNKKKKKPWNSMWWVLKEEEAIKKEKGEKTQYDNFK